MEKRALLAVLLIFVIFALWSLYMSSQRRPAPAPEEIQAPEVQPEEVVEAADTVSTETVEIGVPIEGAQEILVGVRTPRYVARFSTRGGVLTSFKLVEYLLDGDQRVELVHQAENLPLGVALLMKTGERLDLSQAIWSVSAESLKVEAGSQAGLVFELVTEGGLRVTKVCTLDGDTYTLKISLEITGPGSDMVRASEFGWQSGLEVTEIKRRSDDLRNFASLTLSSEGLAKVDLGRVRKREQVAAAGEIRWTAVRSKYFLAAIVPLNIPQAVAHASAVGEEAIGLVLEADRRQAGPQEFMVYAGPLDYQELQRVGFQLEKALDFGWRWIQPLSKLIFRFMLFCHKGIPNYGWVIILLSTITKVLFYPLTQKSFKSMRDMQKLQPKMQEIREKYKNDAQRMNQEVMKLYKEHGVNPLGGCFPMLLQMPVFISLFNVLSKTIELRRAPFVLWIKDLSAPDVLARLPFSLPFIGNSLSLLPILMGVAMFVQQKMQSTDPKQAAMTYMMPVVLTVLFFRFPSGLVLYWLVNNVLTIGHQYLMNRAERTKEVSTTGG